VATRVSEPGHHRALLHRRTGLVAQENQARRLLNDLASFRAWVERTEGRPVPESVAANRWLQEVYDQVVGNIPADLREKLDPVQVFHEVLEHRWFLSEQAATDVGTAEAAASYFADVLPAVPDELTSGSASAAVPVGDDDDSASCPESAVSWRPESSARATSWHGWTTATPAAARWRAHPGLADATTAAPDRAMAASLRSRTAAASAGWAAA